MVVVVVDGWTVVVVVVWCTVVAGASVVLVVVWVGNVVMGSKLSDGGGEADAPLEQAPSTTASIRNPRS
jgi:hypothetical protein